jgi:hypothetical protein
MFHNARRPIRFAVLLATLFALLGATVVARLLRGEQGAVDSPLARLLVVGALIALMISAASAASTARGTRLVVTMLAAVSVALQVGNELVQSHALDLVGHAAMAALLSYTTWTILRTLFRPTIVDIETICASLSAYMLIGLIWSVVYSFVAVVDPNAFRLPAPGETMYLGRGDAINPLYFSYVTLTTLGYGDIVPANHAARTLAIIEAIVGQLLLVVLVARLVGLNVAQAAVPSSIGAVDPEAGARL